MANTDEKLLEEYKECTFKPHLSAERSPFQLQLSKDDIFQRLAAPKVKPVFDSEKGLQ